MMLLPCLKGVTFSMMPIITVMSAYIFQHLLLFTKEMVMEKPSPLLVGREFVRQYYTLLNKAPDFLHR